MNIRIIEIIGIGAVLAVVLAAVGRSVLSLNEAVDDVDAVETKVSKRKRRFTLPLALVAVVAIASTSVGVTMALYSNRPSAETNTFAAGTVSLTNNAAGACATTNLAPADPTVNCTLLTTYAGTLPGYMSLDVFIATKSNAAGSVPGPATNLYNPSAPTVDADITVSSTSPSVNYVVVGGSPTNFGTAVTCPATGLDGNSYTGYNLCYQLSNLLVSASAFTSSSAQVTFTTSITLPSSQPNSYQGSSAAVVLSAHAVQSTNNTINCAVGGASPTAGAVCTPAGSFAWS